MRFPLSLSRIIGKAAAVLRRAPPAAGPEPSNAPPPPWQATPTARPEPEAPGSFTAVTFAHAGGLHQYWLFVPPGAGNGEPLPLVVMLHGCKQHPQDFATGTGMNLAASSVPALVLYPAQSAQANPHHCWSWFRPQHQEREAGEPALIVAMAQDVSQRHPVDSRRVYAAGLSAGGAMAAILAREYPDIFAAVGVHSGIRAGAAHGVIAALWAMKRGSKPAAPAALLDLAQTHPPLIVFHGDADKIVHPRNAQQVVDAALNARLGGKTTVRCTTLQGLSSAGQRFSRHIYFHTGICDNASEDPVIAEHWVLHGAGHAWSGGHAHGSYTEPRGISATQEMLRFFLEYHTSPTPSNDTAS